MKKKVAFVARKKSQGFTLIELTMYLAIFSVFLIVLMEIFINILSVQLESESTSSINQDARFILTRFEYDIRNADQILTPIDIGDITDTFQISKEGIDYAYSLVNGNLELAVNEDNNKLNSFGTIVSDFTVKRIGNLTGENTLEIIFNLTSKTLRKGQQETKQYKTSFGTR